MRDSLEGFEKKKEFLVCVDSDGCAMDTMDSKHVRCFGPCMVEEWKLERWEAPILARWNEINLYTMTRGINRFQGLALMLREVDGAYMPIPGIEALELWVRESDELSEAAVMRAFEQTGNTVFKKALSWSKKVNARIDELSFGDKKPFAGVKEALAIAHAHADVAVVSSANRQALLEEWEHFGLLADVDLLLAQDAGSKAYCIGELVKKGYDKSKVLMIGDAPGDQAAAEKNGVCYYPILVKKEAASWMEFRETAVKRLIEGTYGGSYEREKHMEFRNNLK